MTEQVQTGTSALDTVKLIAAVAILVGGIAAFYLLGTYPLAVRWLIVFEGVNDIGGGSSSMTTATNLTVAYTQFANKAHARNILAYGATITPFGQNGYYTPLHEAERQFVNSWIRTNNIFDGVIDFDQAVRDPNAQTNLLQAYSSDGLHLNPLGYEVMGDCIDLDLFTQ